jgi:ribokinase
LENVDLFTPNEHETAGLDGKNLITTLGARGCHIGETDTHIPAVSVGEVVDTTGAGDTFNGVLAAELARGTNINTAVKSANLASSISVTGKYAVSAIPTKETIERYKNL